MYRFNLSLLARQLLMLGLLLLLGSLTAFLHAEELDSDLNGQGRSSNSEMCNNQKHQLPLLTHYKANVGYSLLGTDKQLDLYNPKSEAEYTQGKTLVPLYNHIFPSTDHYIAMNYDLDAPDDANVIDFLEGICRETGTEFQLIQPGIEVKNNADIQGILKPNLSHAQIIHSLVFGNNLFSIILPPKWDSSKKYPLLMNGYYGLNDNLNEGSGSDMLKVLGRLYQRNKHGAIGIIWNGGGVIATRTVNAKAYTDLNRFMGIVIPLLGIDNAQVVTMGGSRGATTALNMASHPEINQFKVRLVWAGNPYNDLRFVASLAGSTMPDLMYALDWSIGYLGSWDVNFRYPTTNLNAQDQLLNILTGTSDDTVLASAYNLDCPIKLKNLQDRGTEVFLDIGSHDSIVPMIDKVKLLRKYSVAGIPIESRITYLIGHSTVADHKSLLYNALVNISNEMLSQETKKPLITPGKIEYAVLDPSGVVALNTLNKTPLTLEFPRYVNEHVNSFIIGIGTPHARYRMIVRYDKTEFPIGFELDDSGSWVFKIDPGTMTAGQYELVRVEDLDHNANPINTLRSSLPMDGKIIVERVTGDVYQYGSRIEGAIEQGFYGRQKEYQLKIGSSPLMVNYGIVEK